VRNRSGSPQAASGAAAKAAFVIARRTPRPRARAARDDVEQVRDRRQQRSGDEAQLHGDREPRASPAESAHSLRSARTTAVPENQVLMASSVVSASHPSAAQRARSRAPSALGGVAGTQIAL
jgi:hypothetical protein